MAENEELDKLKALLESAAENPDKEAVLQNVLNYIERTKDGSGENQEQLMQKLLADLRSLYRPQATYYEYLLFLGVTALVVSVFGEIERTMLEFTKKITQNVFFREKKYVQIC